MFERQVPVRRKPVHVPRLRLGADQAIAKPGAALLRVTVLALLLGACANGDPGSSGATPAPRATTTTSGDASDGLSREQGEELQRALNTTDLVLDLEPVGPGDDATVELTATVRNAGPNPATRVVLTLTASDGAVWTEMEFVCSAELAVVRCYLGELPSDDLWSAGFALRLSKRPVSVSATVSNDAGPDAAPGDNGAVLRI
jgi:uncharacterized repeat protein (TIGR01451 family)